MTVGHMLASISSEELTYWAALYKLRNEEAEQEAARRKRGSRH